MRDRQLGRRCRQLLTVLSALVAIEIGAAAVAAAFALVETVRGVARPGPTLFMMLCAAGLGTLLVFSVRALWAGRRWGRSPIATWQILQGVSAFGVATGPHAALGWACIALAVVTLGLLLSPPIVACTTPQPDAAP